MEARGRKEKKLGENCSRNIFALRWKSERTRLTRSTLNYFLRRTLSKDNLKFYRGSEQKRGHLLIWLRFALCIGQFERTNSRCYIREGVGCEWMAFYLIFIALCVLLRSHSNWSIVKIYRFLKLFYCVLRGSEGERENFMAVKKMGKQRNGWIKTVSMRLLPFYIAFYHFAG